MLVGEDVKATQKRVVMSFFSTRKFGDWHGSFVAVPLVLENLAVSKTPIVLKLEEPAPVRI